MNVDRSRAAELAFAAAEEAARIVMGVYRQAFDVAYKAADDPVTRADHESNALLCDRLAAAFPGVPIVAEESSPSTYAGFADKDACWFVDPLDGTREFVARNGEFAVMLGLAEKGRATVGVILAPAWGRSFVGIVGEGAWEVGHDGTRRPIHVSSRATLEGASITVSRTRIVDGLLEFGMGRGAQRPFQHGSSGLKGVLVATADKDAYVQPGRAGMRWDACATEALVRAAGGECTDARGEPFDYRDPDLENREGLVATNGAMHAEVIEVLEVLKGR